MIKKRKIQTTLESRLKEKNPLIQVVIGPRQVGKTTAIKAVLNDEGVYETADSPAPLSSDYIEQWWNQASKSSRKILAIDEVQKIDGWAEVIKKLWDTKTHSIKLILSGSAALSIEKNLRETLSGRYELIRATHWSFDEAEEVFNINLKKYIEFGCYPGAQRFLNDLDRWSSYIRDSIVEPAIGRDILQLHPIDNPALFRQVFALATQLPAQVVSLNKLQGFLQDKGAIATIQHYLNLLGSAFLVTGLQKYSESGFRVKASPPKIIVHDNALLRAFERPIKQSIINPKFGSYFENSVGARFLEAGWDVYYWKDKKNEVDFVVLGPQGEKWAVEVKSTKISRKELGGLDQFCKLNKDFTPCLISLEKQEFDDVKSIDAADVLSFQRV